MPKKYKVALTEHNTEKTAVYREICRLKKTHTRILPITDENSEKGKQPDESIAKELQVVYIKVSRARCRFVEQGVEAAAKLSQKNKKAKKL